MFSYKNERLYTVPKKYASKVIMVNKINITTFVNPTHKYNIATYFAFAVFCSHTYVG